MFCVFTDSDDSEDEGEKSAEYLALEEERLSREKQLLLEELERKRRARKLNIPTDDGQVKYSLRDILNFPRA